LRKPATKVHTFESHTDEVLSLAWSPHNATVFGSASSDRRINVWDLNQIGVEQTPDDQEDGPPELLFVHGGEGFTIRIKRMLIKDPGHTARPTDFCWAPGEEEAWMGVSASEDNIVMIWQPTMRIWAGDDVKIDEKELESDAMEGVETTGPSGAGGAAE
jgi:histone-binding protein RBBP4